MEHNCLFTCARLNVLQEHLVNVHNIDFKEETRRFDSEKGNLVAMHVAIRLHNCTFVEFLEWKSKVEKTTNVYYIKSSGMKLSTKNKFQY